MNATRISNTEGTEDTEDTEKMTQASVPFCVCGGEPSAPMTETVKDTAQSKGSFFTLIKGVHEIKVESVSEQPRRVDI